MVRRMKNRKGTSGNLGLKVSLGPHTSYEHSSLLNRSLDSVTINEFSSKQGNQAVSSTLATIRNLTRFLVVITYRSIILLGSKYCPLS
jgi:hypothetical protein